MTSADLAQIDRGSARLVLELADLVGEQLVVLAGAAAALGDLGQLLLGLGRLALLQERLAEVLARPDDTGSPWVDERTRIMRVLDQHRWNRQRAAAALGISRVTLWRRMERHGIRDPLAATST